jgi:imidazolonepropionase-like amidohydrolase
VREGADYIKIIVEDPRIMGSAALESATIAAIVEAAHQAGLKAIAHVTTTAAFALAVDAGVDILTHAPLDAVLDANLVSSITQRGIVSVPTLTMMQTVAKRASQLPTHRVDTSYAHARLTVTAFHQAGVTILAGTDANQAPGSPAQIQHGEALHDELALLVEAGLTPVEVLRAATVLPANYFGFEDRGVIEVGRRADLLLIEGDPTRDIAATRTIRGVWVAGVQVR